MTLTQPLKLNESCSEKRGQKIFSGSENRQKKVFMLRKEAKNSFSRLEKNQKILCSEKRQIFFNAKKSGKKISMLRKKPKKPLMLGKTGNFVMNVPQPLSELWYATHRRAWQKVPPIERQAFMPELPHRAGLHVGLRRAQRRKKLNLGCFDFRRFGNSAFHVKRHVSGAQFMGYLRANC